MARRRRLLGFLLTVALVVGACGGGGDDSGSEDTSGATTTTVSPGAGDTTTTTTSSEPVSGDSDSEWCRQARAAAAGEVDSPLNFNFLTAGAADLERLFKDNRDGYQRIADEAPPEIEDDVEVFSAMFDSMIEIGDANQWNLMAMGSDPAFEATFSDPALETAATNIDLYTTEVCGVDFGVDLGGGLSGPPTTVGEKTDADRFLELFFIPRSILTDEQYQCIGDELAGIYPDGMPTTLNEELANAAQAILETCDLIPEG